MHGDDPSEYDPAPHCTHRSACLLDPSPLGQPAHSERDCDDEKKPSTQGWNTTACFASKLAFAPSPASQTLTTDVADTKEGNKATFARPTNIDPAVCKDEQLMKSKAGFAMKKLSGTLTETDEELTPRKIKIPLKARKRERRQDGIGAHDKIVPKSTYTGKQRREKNPQRSIVSYQTDTSTSEP